MAGIVVAATLLSGCTSLLTAQPDQTGDGFVSGSLPSGEPLQSPLSLPDIDPNVPVEGEVIVSSPSVELISQWSLEQKVASLFVIHVEGTAEAQHRRVVDELGVSGFLILGNNVPRDAERSREFFDSLRTMSEPELLIAIDQEGGAIQRLRPDPFPSATELGGLDPEETLTASTQRHQLVFDAGANVNLGVVADVSPGEDAYIHERAFSDDVDEVTARVSAALEGSIEGVAVAVKHFPGHGLTTEDTHRVIARSPISLGNWFTEHAPPFAAAVDADVDMVMLGHLVVPSVDPVPASLSSQWVDVLRQQWGYQGVIITDDLSMLEDADDERYGSFARNARDAVAAGADIVLDAGGSSVGDAIDRVQSAIAEIVTAVAAGDIQQSRIDAAAARVLELRMSLGGVSRPLQDADAG